MKISWLLILFALFLGSCEQMNKKKTNTIENLEKCIKKNKSDLLDSEIIKNNCVTKLQKKIERFDKDIKRYGGSAGPKQFFEFAGFIENYTSDIVITEFKIEFEHEKNYDEQGNNIICEEKSDCIKYEFAKVFNRWVQPGQKENFLFSINKDNQLNINSNNKVIAYKLKNFCSSKGVEEKTCEFENWNWFIREIKGFYLSNKF